MLNSVRSLAQIVRTNLSESDRSLAMARIDLSKRYSGATLGYLWTVAKPAVFIAVYWFAIAIGVRGGQAVGDVPFIFWLIPGIVPWFFIADALTIGGSSVRHNRRLVTSMQFPIETIPTFTVLALFYVHVILLVITFIIYIFSGYGVSIYVVQIPYYMLCCFSLSLAFAFLLSSLTVLSRDVEHMVRSTVQVGFWLTPILWSPSGLPEQLRMIVLANPIAYVVEGYRNAFVSERWFFEQWEYGLYFWAFVLCLSLLAALLFNRTRLDFADVL